ncbi:hypothetical protein [Paeniglutamicibacter sp. NPDC091659]|uniref:hypothetical protein n=1 Tax=Paeniglutamicibacter sp. NPDC091659 TaxID=3364389 RepID=UPI00382392A4
MLQDLAVGFCLALTPPELRDVRREQWGADLRDAQSIGMSTTAVLTGAATAALHLRATHMIMSTQGMSSLSKGKNMKVALITICSVLTLAGVATAGIQAILPSKEAIPVVNIDGMLESVDHPDDVYIYSDAAGSGTLAD